VNFWKVVSRSRQCLSTSSQSGVLHHHIFRLPAGILTASLHPAAWRPHANPPAGHCAARVPDQQQHPIHGPHLAGLWLVDIVVATWRSGWVAARGTRTVLMVMRGKRSQKRDRKAGSQQEKPSFLHHLDIVFWSEYYNAPPEPVTSRKANPHLLDTMHLPDMIPPAHTSGMRLC
jgi:hypothetical protein